MSKKEFKAAREAMPYPSVSYRLAAELKELTGQEIRVTIPGHFQRGGAPCAADRVLSSRFGAAAAELIREGKFGCMVALRDDSVKRFRQKLAVGIFAGAPARRISERALHILGAVDVERLFNGIAHQALDRLRRNLEAQRNIRV